VTVIGQRPDAGLEEIAAAAGVSRQTVYAHYPSRQVLLAAVVDRITSEVVAAIDTADLAAGPATPALLRWLDVSWQIIDRYPLLLHSSIAVGDAEQSRRDHEPITDRLQRLIARGLHSGEFATDLPIDWLLTATVALGHAAGDEVAGGRMTSAEAAAVLRRSVLLLFGATGARTTTATSID